MTTEKRMLQNQRAEIVGAVKELRRRVETETGADLAYVGSPLNIAGENLLNDGEYNYNVRMALVQLQHAAEGSENDCTATLERIKAFSEELAERAELPPRDQITR